LAAIANDLSRRHLLSPLFLIIKRRILPFKFLQYVPQCNERLICQKALITSDFILKFGFLIAGPDAFSHIHFFERHFDQISAKMTLLSESNHGNLTKAPE
jgi:hypothetical protein